MTIITKGKHETTTESDLPEPVTSMAPQHRAAMQYQHHLWDATQAAARSADRAIWLLDKAQMLETLPHIVRRERAHLQQACRQIRHTLRAMKNQGDQYPQTAALNAITSRLQYGSRIVAMLIVGVPGTSAQKEIHHDR